MTSAVADAVVDLARQGFYPVRLHYPIFRGNTTTCSCGSKDCEGSIGKHPVASAWGKSATQDEEVIREQWQDPWNVGIVLGPCHGIPADKAVVDLEDDTPEGREFADLILQGYAAPTYTSGKSLHRIYRWTPDLPETGKASLTVNGLEMRFGGRGKETQSVAPPSIHQNGAKYEWIPGMSPDDIPIIPLPKHIVDLACKKWAEKASGVSSSGNGDAKCFRSQIGKVRHPGRHNALLVQANHLWRREFQIRGINGIEEQDAIDNVWMALAGANLLVCEPPKTEAEVKVIFESSRTFMYGEFLKEIEAKQKLTAPESAADDRSFGSYLKRHGIRLVPDPSMDHTQQDSERIDEWQCDWKAKYVTKGDEDLIQVMVGEHEVSMHTKEFMAPGSFALRMKQQTNGLFALNQSFVWWDWKTIWNGKDNDKKKQNGITRGLREFLEKMADVEEKKENGIADQIEDIVLAMIGNKDELMTGLQLYIDKGHAFKGRMKCVPNGGGLTDIREKDDPLTGYYFDGEAVWILVKIDEVSRRHRSSYGGTINSRQIHETLESLGFERKQFRRGPLYGRWLARAEKSSE